MYGVTVKIHWVNKFSSDRDDCSIEDTRKLVTLEKNQCSQISVELQNGTDGKINHAFINIIKISSAH